jgi:hypothetical protein
MKPGGERLNAEADAETREVTAAMTRTLAYRHFRESIVHLFTECPQGALIGIARRVAIKDESALKGLEVCEWCQARDRA